MHRTVKLKKHLVTSCSEVIFFKIYTLKVTLNIFNTFLYDEQINDWMRWNTKCKIYDYRDTKIASCESEKGTTKKDASGELMMKYLVL